jgi:CRISPR-associated endonuclease/helicase Cas3
MPREEAVTSTPLSAGDFAAFFEAVHGVPPFPWQDRLLRCLAATGRWPEVLDLPTGAGKTAALDIALFHLALEAARGPARQAPVRIAFVVDRRLIVDDAFERARKLQNALHAPRHPVVARVAAALHRLAGDDAPPVLARRLRGGVPCEDDWARTPNQPTILCSTVDQVGSRLLFRGYGISDRMKPVHAGLLGADCLILLDEAHLSEPFRQTLEAMRRYRDLGRHPALPPAPFQVAWMTATPGGIAAQPFGLCPEDREHPVLRCRLVAAKPARLIAVARQQDRAAAEPDDERLAELARLVESAIVHLAGQPLATPPVIGVVVNRVLRARHLFDRLRRLYAPDGETPRAEVQLVIGPAREADRDALADQLEAIKTGRDARRTTLALPQIVVATQTIEAGADLDFDGLITEIAPLDALRQRFGRLNRAGRGFKPFATIVGAHDDRGKPDPVYGEAASVTWETLLALSQSRGEGDGVDFGLARPPHTAWIGDIAETDKEGRSLLAPKASAPVLMPAYVDLWSQTSPVPAADPEIGLFLHGPDRSSASVQIVWRADLAADDLDPAARAAGFDPVALFSAVPPRPAEAVEVSLAAARAWLRAAAETAASGQAEAVDFADVPGQDEAEPNDRRGRPAFRWAGSDSPATGVVYADSLRPHDVIIVPADYGGCDRWGWNPGCRQPVSDVADRAVLPFAGRRYALRLEPRLIAAQAPMGEDEGATAEREQFARFASALGDLLTDLRDGLLSRRDGAALVDALQKAEPPPCLATALARLAGGRDRKRQRVQPVFPYGLDAQERDRGVLLLASNGVAIGAAAEDEGGLPVTEDDLLGSTPGFRQTLDAHSGEVRRYAEKFAAALGLAPALAGDVALAAYLHDWGKRDARFQALLYGGDWFSVDEEVVLAKSDRRASAVVRDRLGLRHWRHEALSVRLARRHDRFAEAHDPELVLWLIGVHHGYGRPLFPHADPEEPADDPGPQSLSFSFDGWDWPQLFERLKNRYGVWELARLEAIVRLADHRASEAAEPRAARGEAP